MASRWFAESMTLKGEPFASTQWSGGLDGLVQGGCQVNEPFAKFNLAPADAADIQQVVHQPDHLHDLAIHHRRGRLDGL